MHGKVNPLLMDALQTVLEHRTILLGQNVLADFNHEVRPHGDEVLVERSVVQLA